MKWKKGEFTITDNREDLDIETIHNFLCESYWAKNIPRLGPHHTNKGIAENKEFSINIPDVSLIEKTDYCGLVSGSKTDKSELFKVFYGDLGKSPLIEECPVCMSCAVYDAVKLPSNTLFIGEPKEVFTEEKYMTDNLLDINKVNPFTLTMPDNHYWSVGKSLGKAWSIGKNLRGKPVKPSLTQA